MPDARVFDLTLIDRVPRRTAQVRRSNAWHDIDLPLAEQLALMRVEVERLQDTVRAQSELLNLVTAEIPRSGTARAQNLLFSETESNAESIKATARSLTTLTARVDSNIGKATATALDALTVRVVANEDGLLSTSNRITALAAMIDTDIGTATADAISALDTRVTRNSQGITSESRRVDTLTARLDSDEGTTPVDRLTFQVSGPDATRISGFMAAGQMVSVGPAGGLQPFTIRTASKTGNRFTITLGPTTMLAWPSSGSVILRPAGLQQNITLTSPVMDKSLVNGAGEWAVEIGVRIPALAQAQETLEARMMLAENLDGSTTLSGLARWTVKTVVGDLQAGIGLYNDGAKTQLLVQADRFVIMPSGSSLDNIESPFIVDSGRVIIRSAIIKDASITGAKIATATIGDAHIQDASITAAKIRKLDVFDIVADGEIRSGDFELAGRVIPAAAASLSLQGVDFVHDTPGEAGNRQRVEIGWRFSTGAAVQRFQLPGAAAAAASGDFPGTRFKQINLADERFIAGLTDGSPATLINVLIYNNGRIALSITGDLSDEWHMNGTVTMTQDSGLTFDADAPASGSNWIPTDATQRAEVIAFYNGLSTNETSEIVFSDNADGTPDGIAVTTDGDLLTITLQSDMAMEVAFDIADIVDAVNASSAPVTASGTGSIVVDFSGAAAGTIAAAPLSGGGNRRISSGTGYRLTKTGVSFAAGVLGNLQSRNFQTGRDGWFLGANGSAELNGATFRGDLRSSNYVAGSAGWKADRDGDVEFNNGRFRGDIKATSIDLSTANVTGTLTAGHIDSDVRNWILLNSSAGNIPALAGTISRASSLPLDNFDTIVILASGNARIGTIYGFISIPRSVIPFDTTPSSVQGSLAAEDTLRVHVFVGRSGNTLYIASHQDDAQGARFHQAWGVNH